MTPESKRIERERYDRERRRQNVLNVDQALNLIGAAIRDLKSNRFFDCHDALRMAQERMSEVRNDLSE